MTELVEVIIEEIVVKLRYELREEQQYQEDFRERVEKEFKLLLQIVYANFILEFRTS